MEQQPANSDSPDGRNEPQTFYIYDYRNRRCRQPADSTAGGGAARCDADACLVTYTYDAGGNLISQTFHDPPATKATTPCPDCGGTGLITLLTSRKPCAGCCGTGNSPA